MDCDKCTTFRFGAVLIAVSLDFGTRAVLYWLKIRKAIGNIYEYRLKKGA